MNPYRSVSQQFYDTHFKRYKPKPIQRYFHRNKNRYHFATLAIILGFLAAVALTLSQTH